MRFSISIAPRALILAWCCARALLAHGGPTEATDLVGRILAHDSQIRTLQVTYSVTFLQNVTAKELTGTWASKGAKELLTMQQANVPANSYSFDGQTLRSLTAGEGVPGLGEVQPAESASFGLKNHLPRGFTARYVWEHELLTAIENGNATVSPTLVAYDGQRCYQINGHMMTKQSDGEDSMWFEVALDPEKGFMPRYLEEYILDNGQKVTRNIIDEYKLTELQKGIWYPTSLRQRSMNRNSTGEWEAKVTNRVVLKNVVVNEPIDDERFVIKFPDGTKVADYVLAKKADEPYMYIVGSTNDGTFDQLTKQVVETRELGPSTRQSGEAPAQSSESVAADASPRRSTLKLTILASLGAVVVMLSLILIKRRTQRAVAER